jgi:hypothetical protein
MVTMGIALGLCPNPSRSSRCFSRSHAARHAVGVRPGDTAESMPVWLQDVMQIFPTPHFVSFSQAVVYRATGPDIVWPELLVMAVISAVYFATPACASTGRWSSFNDVIGDHGTFARAAARPGNQDGANRAGDFQL